ncbi:hypothetical protein MESS2_310028 [Mesorhizobium metallidurans STM 2683]|uniref:Uncharacterized protein n=1 Tax=Mesorhizobium metallidurans STM 2683 TaxID=1297569 RepID=M5EQN5_9HYPH|nr:hypothetical protein MESS2_310028 [Mesorhizobium metallidurans STM 2683]
MAENHRESQTDQESYARCREFVMKTGHLHPSHSALEPACNKLMLAGAVAFPFLLQMGCSIPAPLAANHPLG